MTLLNWTDSFVKQISILHPPPFFILRSNNYRQVQNNKIQNVLQHHKIFTLEVKQQKRLNRSILKTFFLIVHFKKSTLSHKTKTMWLCHSLSSNVIMCKAGNAVINNCQPGFIWVCPFTVDLILEATYYIHYKQLKFRSFMKNPVL